MPVSLVDFSHSTQYTSSVYIDSNLLIYCRNRLSPKYKKAVQLLGNLILQRVNLCISNLVIDEVWCVLLRVWHRSHTGNNLNLKRFKRNPAVIQNYRSLIERVTRKMFCLPNIQVLSSPPNKIDFARDVMNYVFSENLTPRDGFHLALAIANSIPGFVTADSDFDSLTIPNYDLIVYKY